MITLLKPQNGASLNLLTEEQKAFIANEDARSKVDGGTTFKWNELVREGTDRSKPLSVHFEWNSDDKAAFLELSLSSDFSEVREYAVYGSDANIYNLLYGTVYYWRIRDINGNISESSSFSIERTVRFINVDGTTNVRDIGSYKNADGTYLKQGMIYRGSEFNNHVNITYDGYKALRDDLKLRTDFDMRGIKELEGIESGPVERFGGNRIICTQVGYTSIFTDVGREGLITFFETLADKSVYPLYGHCWGGADRAGSLFFFLENLLGVPYDTAILDYELTSLSIWRTRTRNYKEFIGMLDRIRIYGGSNDNFSDTVRSCLEKYFKISPSTLDDICNILHS